MDIVSKQEPSPGAGGVALAGRETAESAAQGRGPLERQQAVVALGRRAIAPPDLTILTNDAAVLIAEMLDLEHSAVAELSADGSSLELRLQLRNPQSGKCEEHRNTSALTGDGSLADYTLKLAHTVQVTDLAEEQPFRDPLLRGHGIRSAVAVPLQSKDRSFGVLIACSSEERRFDTADELFAETIAHLVATTAGRHYTEDLLATERRRSLSILQTVDAIVLMLDGQSRIQDVNLACRELTGFSLAEIKGRPIRNVFPAPEEADGFRLAFEKFDANKSAGKHESFLLTKHGQRRRIAWSHSVLKNADGATELILLTGIDITEQREAQRRAETAEQAVENVRTATADPASGDADEQDNSAHGQASRDPFHRAPVGGIPSERRNRPRRSYPYHQRIAPVVDGQLPGREDFSTIECNDIGAGGFSYLSSSPPRSETLVVALGTPPMLTYLVAQVAHITRIENDGQRKYLIGCNYIGRADY